MVTLRCKSCNKELIKPTGESLPFGFCANCGEPLCIDCANAVDVSKEVITQRSLVPGLEEIHVTLNIPHCQQCYNIRKTLEKKSVLPGLGGGVVVFFVTFMVAPFIMGFIWGEEISWFNEMPWPLIIFGPVFFGILFGGVGGYFTGLHYRTRIAGRYSYIPSLTGNRSCLILTCPWCGQKQAERDFSRITRGFIEKEPLLTKLERTISGTEKKGAIPNVIVCSKCGYLGPFTLGMGLRIFVQKYGVEPLRHTWWYECIPKK